MSKTVALIYGLGEGKWQSRKFRHLLALKGYTIIQDPHKADILITHSGGSLLIPPTHAARIILVINHTYWPGRSLLSSHWIRQAHGIRMYGLGWLPLTVMNCIYLCKLGHTIRLAKAWPHRAETLSGMSGSHGIFVRTRHDEFCNPQALISSQPNNCYISLPGGHDDCWFRPEPYVDLLQSEQHEHDPQP